MIAEGPLAVSRTVSESMWSPKSWAFAVMWLRSLVTVVGVNIWLRRKLVPNRPLASSARVETTPTRIGCCPAGRRPSPASTRACHSAAVPWGPVDRGACQRQVDLGAVPLSRDGPNAVGNDHVARIDRRHRRLPACAAEPQATVIIVKTRQVNPVRTSHSRAASTNNASRSRLALPLGAVVAVPAAPD